MRGFLARRDSRSTSKDLDRAGAMPGSPLRRGFRCAVVTNLTDVRERDLPQLVSSAEPRLVEIHDDIHSLEVIGAVRRWRTMHGTACPQIVGPQMLNELVRARRRRLRDLLGRDHVLILAAGGSAA